MDDKLFEILEYGVYGASILLILIGLYAVLTKRSLIKIVIGMSIIDGGIHLLLITIGYLKGGTAPIFSPGYEEAAAQMVDPVPQALVLTAIVIGFGVTAVALSLIIRLYRHHHTLEIDEIKRLKW
ncbi:MAG: cation:proton antiporter [Bacteroidetes bacterium]|nr:MAG: cation:proton antiporter [Bacteroidota bacterium]RLD49175.1 MAG: cation:proton antiporter [Bacteroidota bacterium]RLD74382.1 MAG: cation:proton antiporter [Bacteroidota bacterium]RLD86280.1 MAG: cation:proton antiporter [Bacteroidota bacterium]HHL57733.1 cation:proton antiporter [Bacteroidota bacterium]